MGPPEPGGSSRCLENPYLSSMQTSTTIGIEFHFDRIEMRMKAQIGLMIEGQMGLNWERWDRLLALAERAGFQNVFCSDHIVDPEPPDQDSLELWAALTYAAAKTKRIEFGPLVSPVTFRHPVMALRQAAAVDDLSAGRLVFGLGAGWNEREHENFGIGFYNFKTRFAQLTDALEITRRLLDESVLLAHTLVVLRLEFV